MLQRLSLVVSVSALIACAASAQHATGQGKTGATKNADGGKKAVHERKANHLVGVTSPYLLQHLYNPVDWYPWGEAALARAKKEKKPIFLSIGYSACHWCHVMERESFEDAAIAKYMNENFVCIKVDREERPDIDEIYMAAVVRLNNGNGGWPMSVFLTPERKPFFGGTYWPPTPRFGRPGFRQVLEHCHGLWKDKREKIAEFADRVVDSIARESKLTPASETPGDALLDKAVDVAKSRFDPQWGGFGSGRFAPKFPHATELSFLLRYGARRGDDRARAIALATLGHMARGGMYDQVGGGFARYSVDREWLVPHFEKMLYDNSQLASLYLEAYQASGDALFARIASEVLDYVKREMTSPDGAFYSTTDADSEGEEGKFFVWSLAEFREVVGAALSAADAELLARFFALQEKGNFEGHNVLSRRRSIADFAEAEGIDAAALRTKVKAARAALYARRAKRVPPLKDDKILTAWNGLMLSAFAQGAQILGRKDYLETARANARFLLSAMRDANGRFYRSRRGDKAAIQAVLVDYASAGRAMLDLYEADPRLEWIEAARAIQAQIEEFFGAGEKGSYYATAKDGEALIVRRTTAQESSMPSGAGLAAELAARLGLLAGEPELLARAHAVLRFHSQELTRFPNAYGQLLRVVDFLQSDPREVYVVGAAGDGGTDAFLQRLRGQWPPYRVFAHVEAASAERLTQLLPGARGKTRVDGKATAYVCRNGLCKAPTTEAAAMDLWKAPKIDKSPEGPAEKK